MTYNIEMSSLDEKQLTELTPNIQTEIAQALRALKFNPHPHSYKKLVDRGKTYRIRVGNYRIIY